MCVYTSIALPSFISHIRDCCFKRFKQYVQRVLNRCCGCDLEDRKFGFFVYSGHIYSTYPPGHFVSLYQSSYVLTVFVCECAAVITISLFVQSLLFCSHWVHSKSPCQREISSCNYLLMLTCTHTNMYFDYNLYQPHFYLAFACC